MPRRALLLSNFYYPREGGIEAAARATAEGLQSLGYDVALATNTPVDPDSADGDRFPVYRQPSFSRLRELAGNADVAVVHDDTLAMVLPVLCTCTPVAVVHHCLKSVCPSGTGHRKSRTCLPKLGLKCWACRVGRPNFRQTTRRMIRFYFARHIFRLVDANVCLSDFSARLFRFRNGCVIPNPVNVELFHPKKPVVAATSVGAAPACASATMTDADIDGPSDESPRSPRLAMVGRLSPEKGMAFGLELLQQLRDQSVVLDIYGQGPAQADLGQHAARLGLSRRVNFRGWRSGAELADAYRQADLLLVPSDINETFCMVVAEALACQTPVITSTRGALPQTVGPGGYAVPLEDRAAWVAAVSEMLESPNLRRELAQAGHRHVRENYSIEAVAAQWDQLATRLIDGPRRSCLLRRYAEAAYQATIG
jgi:glycosyltransferase involved in cell wall biosynthesis